jgi:hypothetical protein
MGQAHGAQNCVERMSRKKPTAALMTTEELAERWKVSVGHLRNLRSLGGGPRFIRVATRGIRYRLSVIEEWERSK